MGESQDVRVSYGASVAPLDPESGQRGAFPGLDETADEDELFYGPASDGLEYLRMVRHEAQSVPKLLKVQKGTSVQAEQGPESAPGGRYEDGAFIAEGLDALDEEMRDADSLDEDDAQGIYYHQLLQRFTQFRSMVRKPPGDMSSCPRGPLPRALQPNLRQGQWSYDLRRTRPTTRALVQASQEDIIRGIRRVESLLTKASFTNEMERTNLGSWTWALLGRCRDVGILDSEDIGVLRSLAKSALALSARLLRAQHDHAELERIADVDEEDVQAGSEEGDGEDSDLIREAERPTDDTSATPEDLEAARVAMLSRLQEDHFQENAGIDAETSTKANVDDCENALMALDIIITIVGGAFGQKDLLDLRAAWQ